MEAIGCSRRVFGDDGIWYDLPHGEYRLRSNPDGYGVRDQVAEFTTALNPIPDVIVTICRRIVLTPWPES